MAILTSIFFSLGLILSLVLGSQTRSWTWGPALLCFGIATATACPIIWRQRLFPDTKLAIVGFATIVWYSLRASISPVAEFATSDLLLLGSAVSSFIVTRVVFPNPRATSLLIWTLALLLIASIGVMARQWAYPQFTPIFPNRPTEFPSGFFGHYNDCANFLIGSSFVLGGFALFGRHFIGARIVWALISACGLVAVYFTHSRGGILATVIGLAVFTAMALIIGQRTKARWFAPILLCLPVMGLIVGWSLWAGWQNAQEIRDSQVGVSNVLDNPVRLYLFGVALSCANLHPLAGGGSRSFSWESYRFWDVEAYGHLAARPDMVHNEFIQSVTDYGLVGGGLLLLLIGSIGITALYRTLLLNRSGGDSNSIAVSLGGIASLFGMLVQSMFSFVFHLLPGTVLLGLAMGIASAPACSLAKDNDKHHYLSRIITSVLLLAIAVPLLHWGRLGSKTVNLLWPVYFSGRTNISEAERLSILSAAVGTWPQATLYADLGMIRHKAYFAHPEPSGLPIAKQAISDYRSALALNPYETSTAIRLGQLLALVGRDTEALSEFERAIQLQGQMETAFKARYHMATHLLKMGLAQLNEGSPAKASSSFERGLAEFTESSHHIVNLALNPEGIQLKSTLAEGLGLSLEQQGDLEGALAGYQTMIDAGGSRGHYRVATLLGSLAKTAWSERRPSEALTRFQEARQRMELASELPAGVTPEMKAEYITFLDRSIKYLIEAKVEPLKKPEE